MKQNDRNEKSIPCSWCCEGNILYMGTGMFRDLDSDCSYGIPICCGCGGLGVQFPDDDKFKNLCERVFELRFQYCPVGNLPTLPPGARLSALDALIQTVSDLYETYGEDAAEDCFAKHITSGAFDEEMDHLREAIEGLVNVIHDVPFDPDAGRTERSRDAAIAAVRNDLDTADKLYERLLNERPECSITRHDYATYLIQFRRDLEGAVEHFKASCEMEPVRALHFIQTARCLGKLDLKEEAAAYYRRAHEAPDFDALPQEYKELVTILIDKYRNAQRMNN